MLLVILVSVAVSAALIAGAAWGIFSPPGRKVEGFIIALAGGALVISLVMELIEPALAETDILLVSLSVAAGAGVFTLVDWLIDEKWGNSGGGGLLAAITLDGIPENLALGVALIGAGPLEVAALAGSIFLSNLPEAAGGARRMRGEDHDRMKVFLLWIATAALLSLAAIAGNRLLSEVGPHWLAGIRCFAAGAVVASLATEVFPNAFREDHHLAGVATTLGLLLALFLSSLSN